MIHRSRWGVALLTTSAWLVTAVSHAQQLTEASTISGSGATVASGSGSTVAAPVIGWLLGIGDSKTEGDDWLPLTAGAPQARLLGSWAILNRGVAGTTVATTSTNMTSVLAAPLRTTTPTVLINFGANDVGALPAPATWIANYLIIIDAVRAIWPTAAIYLHRPWRRGFLTQCNSLATWIDTILTLRTGLHLGPDERIWFEAGDDGVSLSLDGVHYNPAGELIARDAWVAVLWP